MVAIVGLSAAACQSNTTGHLGSNVGVSGSTFTLTNGSGLKATGTATIVSKTIGVGDLVENPARGVFEGADVKFAVQPGSLEYNAANFQFLRSDGNTYTFGGGNVMGALASTRRTRMAPDGWPVCWRPGRVRCTDRRARRRASVDVKGAFGEHVSRCR